MEKSTRGRPPQPGRRQPSRREGSARWIAAFAPLAGAAACGGAAFSDHGLTDAGTLDSAVPDDADTEAGPSTDGGDADAALPFCAGQGAHSFCEDFDTAGVPGKFVELTSSSLTVGGGVKIVADTSSFVSSPNSALAETPALLRQSGDQANALLEATIAAASTSGATRFKWSAQLQIGPGCVANADGAVVGRLTVGSYGLAIDALPSQTQLVELSLDNDGGTTGKALAHGFPAVPTEPQWLGLGISLDLRLKTATVTVDGTAVLDTVTLTLSPPSSASSGSLFLGAEVKDSQGISPGCRVHVDNVLFDVQ